MTVKLTISQSDLASATAWAARTLPARPYVPVYAGLRLTAREGTLIVDAFDGDNGAQISVTGVRSDKPGAVLIPGRLFTTIAASLPAKPADLELDGAMLRLACGTSKFSLNTLPLDEYPQFPETSAPAGSCSPAGFAQAVASVLPAVSSDTELPVLTTVCLEASKTGLVLAATDRYELATVDLPWTPADPGMDPRTALVPGKALAAFVKGLPDAGEITISLPDPGSDGTGLAGFASDLGRRRVTIRCAGGEFVDYRSLMGKNREFPVVVEADAAGLVQVIKRVGIAAERKTAIHLKVGDGELTLRAGTGAAITAVESLPAKTEGGPLEIGFGPELLRDALLPVPGQVRIRMTGSFKPALVTRAEDDQFRALVMPMRTENSR